MHDAELMGRGKCGGHLSRDLERLLEGKSAPLQPLGAYDLLIAGHARSLAATLVTNNVAEFSRVRGLLLENWARS